MSLKRTAFFDRHVQAGGKMVAFAGFEMPVQYAGIVEEHRCVRERVGVFDVSHMGEVEVSGTDALAFVQSITINDASKLTPGRVQYSAMCYPDGGIVDDLLVYRMADRFMLVINAANTAKDIAWMQENLRGNVVLTDKSDATSLLAVQGPRSLDTLRKLTSANLASLAYYHGMPATIAGVEMLLSRTGYTGELGYELYFPSDRATGERIWDALLDAGKEFGIAPIGLGARDTLRLEMGFCLYGNDIDGTTNPLEAGLGWITRPAKGNFVGRDAIRAMKEEGLKRKLVAFTVNDRAFPRHGYPITIGGVDTGHVTSGTFSPTLERGIGMGYVPADHATIGSGIDVIIRNTPVPATIVSLPFVKKDT
jgi:aminomethyltransferase